MTNPSMTNVRRRSRCASAVFLRHFQLRKVTSVRPELSTTLHAARAFAPAALFPRLDFRETVTYSSSTTSGTMSNWLVVPYMLADAKRPSERRALMLSEKLVGDADT